jgi:hypothetical protein
MTSRGGVARRRHAAASRCRRLCVTLSCNVVLATSVVGQSVLASFSGSTRAAGLAGAGAAVAGDAGAIFANPAAIATVHRVAFDGSYERHPGGTTFGAAALALRLGRFDWGVGAQALGGPGASLASADLLGVSSLVVRKGVIALGGSAKYTRQTLSGTTAEAWAGDAGLAIAVFDIMALGLSVQNIGGDSLLPRRTRAGFTMNYVDPQGTYRLLTTLEGQWPQGGAAFIVVGVEGGVVRRGVGVIVRGGYAGHSVTTAAAPFTVGASLELGGGRLHLDYAYRAGDAAAADLHRVGLRWTP